MTGPTTEQAAFCQSLREMFARATDEDIDRIFTRLVSDCIICGGEHIPCRQIPDVLKTGCSGPSLRGMFQNRNGRKCGADLWRG